jgi:hypothetical protein
MSSQGKKMQILPKESTAIKHISVKSDLCVAVTLAAGTVQLMQLSTDRTGFKQLALLADPPTLKPK